MKILKTLGILVVVSAVFTLFGTILNFIKIGDVPVPTWPFIFFVAYFGTVKSMKGPDLPPSIVSALSGFTAAFSGTIVSSFTQNQTASIVTMVVLLVAFLVAFMVEGGSKWFKDPIGVFFLIIVMMILPADKGIYDFVTMLISIIFGWLLCLGLSALGTHLHNKSAAKTEATAAKGEAAVG